MRSLLVVFILFTVSPATAEVQRQKFAYASFAAAAQADSYLRFDMESSLIGFLTARFPGFAKEFTLSWRRAGEKVSQLKVAIPVDQMDTDRDSRTQEMKEDCLEIARYPEIVVEIPELDLRPGEVYVTAKGLIRGKTVDIPTRLTLSEAPGGGWTVSGVAPVKLAEVNIINPTIAKGVASFDDRVKISYRFKIPQP